MRIIRRACIRGTARCSQLRVLDGWIYLKLELLRYPSSLDFSDHAFFLPSIFSNLKLIIFFFRNIAHYRFLVNGHGRSNEQSICHRGIRVKCVFARFTPLNTMGWERTRE